jgi:hypothetical protein
MADLHGDLIAKLKSDVLSPGLFDAVLERAIELERSPEAPDRRAALDDELARLEREIGRYTDAVAQGGSCPRSWRHSVRAKVAGRRSRPSSSTRTASRCGPRVRSEGGAAGAPWTAHGLAGAPEGEPAQARQILRKLLEGRVVMQPHVNGRERTYEWTATATYGRILTGIVGVTTLVPPGGFSALAQQPIDLVIAA